MVNEGSGFVEVCAEIVEGTLERTVIVQLSTANGTALGNRGWLFYFSMVD